MSRVLGLGLIGAGHLQLLGWFLLIVAIVPAGDALIVLRHRGSKATAYGVHGATAALLVAAGALLLLG